MLHDHEDFAAHEQVAFVHSADADLSAIVAIHSTALGPAIGGLRVWTYASDAEALADVLRLSKGMSYKAAVAGIPFGGGKAVVILRRGQQKAQQLLRAMGVEIERLGGRYVTGEDVGTTCEDMAVIREATSHVMGLPQERGGSGDPSANTALGCFVGISAAVEHALHRGSLHGLHVAVQGVGNVGANLCHLLAEAGARLTITDTDGQRLDRVATKLRAKCVAPDKILDVDADVFAPCAMGAVLDDSSLARLKTPIVAGGANNQLRQFEHGHALLDRGILYAPDFVINAGGMIQLAAELTGETAADVERRVRSIAATLARIFTQSAEEGRPTSEVANELAATRIAAARLAQTTSSGRTRVTA